MTQNLDEARLGPGTHANALDRRLHELAVEGLPIPIDEVEAYHTALTRLANAEETVHSAHEMLDAVGVVRHDPVAGHLSLLPRLGHLIAEHRRLRADIDKARGELANLYASIFTSEFGLGGAAAPDVATA